MKFNVLGSSSLSAPAPELPADHPPVAGSAAKCPVDHSKMGSMARPTPTPPADASAPAKCPVDHEAMRAKQAEAAAAAKKGDAAQCPIDHSGAGAGGNIFGAAVGAPGALDPKNNMPVGLSATERAPGQRLHLPTEKTLSSIPRPKEQDEGGSGVWEYPSPQQFYNALVRKGWETPEESIEDVVDIHNWINEGAWDEVMKWEKRLPGGTDAQLARFQGRPGDLSPKARIHLFLSKLFPESYSSEPPFDRHDWIVTRPILGPDGQPARDEQGKRLEKEQRYVIDYYSGGLDPNGFPIFSLDVRPALDNFTALSERVRVAVEEWRNGGGQA